MPEIKGTPTRVLEYETRERLGDIAVDCRPFNAASVAVLISGTSPQGTVSVEGASEAGGNYLPLSDAQARQTLTASASFDVVVGTGWIKIRLASVSGTFGPGRGFTVVVTPYISPGQAQINVTNTAAQNLAQVGGAGVSLGQKTGANSLPVVLPSDQTVPVSGPLTDAQMRATAVPVDTELPAGAPLADGAANPTTPTVGAAKLAYNGATWDRERIATVLKNIAAQAVTAGTPVTVWTPTAGKKFRVLGWALSLSVAGSVILKDNATEFLRTPLMAAGAGLVSHPMGNGYLSAAANNTLKVDVSASGNVSGYLIGVEE